MTKKKKKKIAAMIWLMISTSSTASSSSTAASSSSSSTAASSSSTASSSCNTVSSPSCSSSSPPPSTCPPSSSSSFTVTSATAVPSSFPPMAPSDTSSCTTTSSLSSSSSSSPPSPWAEAVLLRLALLLLQLLPVLLGLPVGLQELPLELLPAAFHALLEGDNTAHTVAVLVRYYGDDPLTPVSHHMLDGRDHQLGVAGIHGDVERRLVKLAERVDIGAMLQEQLGGTAVPVLRRPLGTSPLHLAAQYGHHSTAEVLLRAGVSRDARTKVDRTPLHMAATEGHSSIVELLVRAVAPPLYRP
ncbi:hypothetical protein CRUP_012339 [Coryphaenoides rupestris]|nr:hypothetical protein CRUP_012339 [Coryphaenoides rupestris]